jgi:2'-5' RNA ligase
LAAERNEHLVVVMLEPMPKGEEFEIWPMHITLVPWFPCDDAVRLDEVLSMIAKKHKAFEVKAGKITEWGGKEKFKVLKIDGDWRLLSLHWDVFRSLEKNGFHIHQKDYLGEKYTPHITLRNSLAEESKYQPGDTIKIERFTLVRQVRLKGSGRMIKSLVRDYELG